MNFYQQSYNYEENIPFCKNNHIEKDVNVKIKRKIVESTRRIFTKKIPLSKPLKFSREEVFDRVTRRKANEIFNTINEIQNQFSLKKNEFLQNKKKFDDSLKKETKKIEEYEPIRKGTKNFMLKTKNKEKNNMNESMLKLLENSQKPEYKPRSSALNVLNLIPKAYQDHQITESDEIDMIKFKIQTSVEKNSSKIYGIDRLVKGKIRTIFGKGNKYKELMKPNLDLKSKKRRKRTKTRFFLSFFSFF